MPDAQDGGLQNTRVQEQENICSCPMAVITEGYNPQDAWDGLMNLY